MAQSGLIFRPPSWRGKLSGTWQQDGVSFTAVGNYIGGLRDNRFQPAMRVPRFVTVDAVLNCRQWSRGLLGGTSLAVSIQNILNQIPPSIRSLDPAALDRKSTRLNSSH